MTLQDILSAKGGAVYTVRPEATLKEVVEKLVEHNVGALLVCHEAEGSRQLRGIVTERDLLHAQATGKGPLEKIGVAEIMTTHLITGSPSDAIDQVMGLMTSRRIRHLPVLDEGNLVGMVSIGDLVKAQLERLATENRFMKDYIRNRSYQ